MISKSVIVFWSVACLTIFMHLSNKDPHLTVYFIFGMGLIWAMVIIPMALIGTLFKSNRVYSTKMRVIRGGVLGAIGLMTFVIANASQQAKAPQWQSPTITTIRR